MKGFQTELILVTLSRCVFSQKQNCYLWFLISNADEITDIQSEFIIFLNIYGNEKVSAEFFVVVNVLIDNFFMNNLNTSIVWFKS